MSAEEIEQFLRLGSMIHEKIDILDVNTVVQAVTDLYDQKKPTERAVSGDANDRGKPDIAVKKENRDG